MIKARLMIASTLISFAVASMPAEAYRVCERGVVSSYVITSYNQVPMIYVSIDRAGFSTTDLAAQTNTNVYIVDDGRAATLRSYVGFTGSGWEFDRLQSVLAAAALSRLAIRIEGPDGDCKKLDSKYTKISICSDATKCDW